MEKSVQQVLQWAKEGPLLLPFMLYLSIHLLILLPFFFNFFLLGIMVAIDKLIY